MSDYEEKFDLQAIYSILRKWAKNGIHEVDTYSHLAQEYRDTVKENIDPHTELNVALGMINRRLAIIGAPPISALVVKKSTGEPGGGFWGCSSNVPARPSNKDERSATWASLVKEVISYDWPSTLP